MFVCALFIGEEDGLLVKAVSAGSRMIDRGIAFVDRARLDNWTGNNSRRCYSNCYNQFMIIVQNLSFDTGCKRVIVIKQTSQLVKAGHAMAYEVSFYRYPGYIICESEQIYNDLNTLGERHDGKNMISELHDEPVQKQLIQSGK